MPILVILRATKAYGLPSEKLVLELFGGPESLGLQLCYSDGTDQGLWLSSLYTDAFEVKNFNNYKVLSILKISNRFIKDYMLCIIDYDSFGYYICKYSSAFIPEKN